MDKIAARRGKWVWEVLELTPEQLALESICVHFTDGEEADWLREVRANEAPIMTVRVIGG